MNKTLPAAELETAHKAFEQDGSGIEPGREGPTIQSPELASARFAVQRLWKMQRELVQSYGATAPTHSSQSDSAVDPLRQWRATARRTFGVVALFSLFVNVLM